MFVAKNLWRINCACFNILPAQHYTSTFQSNKRRCKSSRITQPAHASSHVFQGVQAISY